MARRLIARATCALSTPLPRAVDNEEFTIGFDDLAAGTVLTFPLYNRLNFSTVVSTLSPLDSQWTELGMFQKAMTSPPNVLTVGASPISIQTNGTFPAYASTITFSCLDSSSDTFDLLSFSFSPGYARRALSPKRGMAVMATGYADTQSNSAVASQIYPSGTYTPTYDDTTYTFNASSSFTGLRKVTIFGQGNPQSNNGLVDGADIAFLAVDDIRLVFNRGAWVSGFAALTIVATPTTGLLVDNRQYAAVGPSCWHACIIVVVVDRMLRIPMCLKL